MLHQGLIGYGAGGAAAAPEYNISNSVWVDGANDYIGETTIWDGSTTKWAMSIWFKRGDLGRQQYLWYWRIAANGNDEMAISANDTLYWGAETAGVFQTTRVFRDTTAWTNIVAVWDTAASNGSRGDDVNDRMRLYVNGVHETAGTLSGYPGDETESAAVGRDTSAFLNVGAKNAGSPHNDTSHWDGYLADFIILDNPDGATPAAMGLGKFDANNNWIPLDPAGLTFGSGGCWFDFQTNSDYGSDKSGNSNDMTDYSMTTAQQTVDTPTDAATPAVGGTGNYASWNPLHHEAETSGGGVLSNPPSFSNGNLRVDKNASGTWRGIYGNMAVHSGKWYCEITFTSIGHAGYFGIAPINEPFGNVTDTLTNADSWGYSNAGKIFNSPYATGGNPASDTSYGDTYTTGDIISMALDMDNGNLFFAKNGTWQDSATAAEIAAGTTTNRANTTTGAVNRRPKTFAWWGYGYSGVALITILNTGQNTFAYTPPDGFLGWSTGNIAAPAIVDPTAHFNVVKYTGTGSAQDITWGGNSALTADHIVIKNTSQADEWKIVDRIRGATKEINWDANNAESTDSDGIDDLSVTNGFGLGSGAAGYNDSTEVFVAAGWAAGGGTGSANTDGTTSTTISVNTTAGFSYGTYVGTGSAATLGHGLGVVPELIFCKNRDEADAWICYAERVDTDAEGDYPPEDGSGSSSETPGNYFVTIDSNAARSDDDTAFNDDVPTSSVFTIGTTNAINTSTENYVFYAWASVPGFSEFGWYYGNGESADGPYVWCGFRPKWLLQKKYTATGSWTVVNSAVDIYNPTDKFQTPDVAAAQETGATIDILATGFKIKSTFQNTDGQKYIFAAFAEYPFGGSGVSQARAR